MEIVFASLCVVCVSLVALAVVGGNGGQSRAANKAIDVLVSIVSLFVGK